MNYSQLSQFVADQKEKNFKTLIKKNNDYSVDDALSNFKKSGDMAGIPPYRAALVLIGTKMARLQSLLHSEKTANFESVDDTINDMINYLYLLSALLNEEDIESKYLKNV